MDFGSVPALLKERDERTGQAKANGRARQRQGLMTVCGIARLRVTLPLLSSGAHSRDKENDYDDS